MLSRSFTCSVLQRNTASIINIGFNCVFVSVRKVNLSAQLLYIVMVKKYSLKVADTQQQKRFRSGTQKAKGWAPLRYIENKVLIKILAPLLFAFFKKKLMPMVVFKQSIWAINNCRLDWQSRQS